MINPDPNCPRCHGEGIVQQGNVEVVCSCVADQVGRIDEEGANIPAKFRRRSFDNFTVNSRDQAFVFDRVKEFVDHFKFSLDGTASSAASEDKSPGPMKDEKNGLLLYGGVGTGKTHLAVATLRALIAKGHSGLYWNVNDLFRAMRSNYSQGEGDDELLEELATAEILLLDDLGTHRNTEHILDRLYLIINRRYDALLPIIVTTNLDQQKLFEEFNDRIASRLNEMCYLVGFTGGDFRLKALER